MAFWHDDCLEEPVEELVNLPDEDNPYHKVLADVLASEPHGAPVVSSVQKTFSRYDTFKDATCVCPVCISLCVDPLVSPMLSEADASDQED